METNCKKVLIVDDEPKIRRGLRCLIDRMALPLEVCSEAEDGETALEEAEKHRPDILLVDINMPFINGLDFIERLRHTRTDSKIIVISGYEEFSYVQRALALNVQAYLLKPIDSEQLEKALIEAIGQLDSERSARRHFEWAIARIGESRETLQEEFLRDAAEGRLAEEEIRDFRVYFRFPEPKRMVLAVISVRGTMNDKPWQHLLHLYVLKDIMAESTEGIRYHYLFTDDQSNVLLLYDADETMDETIRLRVINALSTELNISVRYECEPAASLTKLSAAYDKITERMYGDAEVSPIVEEAIQFIGRNYSDAELDLAKVAESLKIHPVYLSRLMKQEIGMPFARYLSSVRISKAVQLMRDPKMRIRQIAEMVGYSGATYFSTAFKKVLGISPAEYRAEDKRK